MTGRPETTKKAHTRRRRLYALYGILATLTLIFSVGTVYARYVMNKTGYGTVTAREFYFTSNLLSDAETVPTYDIIAGTDGTASVSFEIYNYADELRVSDHNITYSVTLTYGTEKTYESSGALIAGTAEKKSNAHTVTGLEAGKTYLLTAATTQQNGVGFVHTLQANLRVLPGDPTVYKHLDTTNDEFVVLTVWTHNVKGEATIGIPAGLIPDSTDPALASVVNYSGSYTAAAVTDAVNFSANTYSSHTYRFFRATPGQAYTADQFPVTVGGVGATNKSTID